MSELVRHDLAASVKPPHAPLIIWFSSSTRRRSTWSTVSRADPFGVRVIVSRDGGETFDVGHEYVLSHAAFSWDWGYPSTVCCDDGLLVTAAYSLLDLNHEERGTCCLTYRYSQDLFVG